VTAQLSPPMVFRAFDSNGGPLAFGQLFTYSAGTTTKQATYVDATQLQPNTNPIILNSRGEANLWLDPTLSYKYVLAYPTDSDPPANPITTTDNIQGVLNPTRSIIPSVNNLFTLGSPTSSWANLYLGPDDTPIFDPVTGQVGSYPVTAAETSLHITPASFVFPPGDIRRYGATLTGDSTTAIQTAVNVNGAGGPAVFIPAGRWFFSTTIQMTGQTSMYGVGATSQLQANACDGLNFPAYTLALPLTRVIRDFTLFGSGATSNKGILSKASPAAAWSINFANIQIQNFSVAIYLNGFRNCTFSGITTNQNYYGAYFIDQNTNCRFFGCSFINNSAPPGTGGTWGISFQTGAGSLSTQSTQFMGCYVFGYDINVNMLLSFETQFDDCDLSNANVTCVNISSVIKGFWLTNCWIETNNAGATTGIIIAPQAVANGSDIHILSNIINCTTGNAGSIGVSIPGANQNGMNISDNALFNWSTGISNISGTDTFLKFNRFNACTTWVSIAVGAVNNEVGPNFGITGTPLAFVTTTPPGFKYYGNGSFTLTTTGGGGSGIVSWSANGSQITVSTSGITGTATGTTMTGSGVPAVLWPVSTQSFVSHVTDNSVGKLSVSNITAGGVMTFFADANGGAFTASGNRGISAGVLSWNYL
jgi:hypothetical protein